MRRALLAPLLGLALLLTGCAATVSLTPAPDATSVGCAEVVVRVPEAIGSAEHRNTDAQGTAAWGTPASVVLTCGVAEPAVASQTCYTQDGVDWLRETRTVGGQERGVLISYGRSPAVQVVVDQREVSVNDVVAALSDPVRDATRSNGRKCITLPDASTAPSP